MTEKKIQLPEAPASINFHVVDKDGFNYQITLRDHTENALMGRVKSIREWLVGNDFVPRGQQGAQQPAGNGSANTPDLPADDPGYCTIHSRQMKQHKAEDGSGDEWYSHKTDDPAYAKKKGYCRGNPA